MCMHVCTCACTHMCTQPQGWLLSQPPTHPVQATSILLPRGPFQGLHLTFLCVTATVSFHAVWGTLCTCVSGCLSSAKTPVTPQVPTALLTFPATSLPPLSCPPRQVLTRPSTSPGSSAHATHLPTPPSPFQHSPRLSHPCPISFLDPALSNVGCASRVLLPSPREPGLRESRPLFACLFYLFLEGRLTCRRSW